MSSVTILIAVFKGDPLDYISCRHTGIVLEYDGQQRILHITGARGFFTFQEELRAVKVENSRRLAADGIVNVARIPARDIDLFRTIVANTHINNEEERWNCQNFVGDALARAVKAHLISNKQFLDAIDNMATVLAEATDIEP
ncbi:hypothetical protein TWF696_005526 [Orbilia brochopaga]|uniref:Uncharacterized protein n=1 Tax=Orbilia brochopaga TaxID=3140254 RepID=A0AAV9V1T4_9PEZI